MSKKLPDDPAQLAAMCQKYRQQLVQHTQKLEQERMKSGMEEYYLTSMIRDFEALCKNHGVDFSVVLERDKERRRN